jgi:hypothetical protein
MKTDINPEKKESNNTDGNDMISKLHPSIISNILKSIIGFIVFICVGYYSLWLSSNYVKKETFDSYMLKQDQQMTLRFDQIQNRLEVILNQQIITTEQFKNLNLILNTQQKSLDNLNDRLTYLERIYLKNNAATN